MTRGRRLLIAQRRPRFRGVALRPLGDPPGWLDAEGRCVWSEIRAASPARLASIDGLMLGRTAAMVAAWRRHASTLDQAFLRRCYRALGDWFVPMPARRLILFPGRARQ